MNSDTKHPFGPDFQEMLDCFKMECPNADADSLAIAGLVCAVESESKAADYLDYFVRENELADSEIAQLVYFAAQCVMRREGRSK